MSTVGTRRPRFVERDVERDDLAVRAGDGKGPPSSTRGSVVLAGSESRGTAINVRAGPEGVRPR